MDTLPLRKYLFRERVVRVILKEWKLRRDKQFWLSLNSLSKGYNLPYFRVRNFLIRLAKDGIITWRHERDSRRTPSDFRLTGDSEKKLQAELLYASSV
jgi:hypothetical protein